MGATSIKNNFSNKSSSVCTVRTIVYLYLYDGDVHFGIRIYVKIYIYIFEKEKKNRSSPVFTYIRQIKTKTRTIKTLTQ